MRNKVVFFPMLSQMTGNPYWTMLASGLKDAGVEVVEEPECYKIGWLFKHRKLIDIIHIHYFQSLYCNSSHTRARLIYVLRLTIYLILARLLGYRTVLTLHNLEPTNALKPAWVDYLGHWVAVNLTERVIVHCKEAGRKAKARYGRGSGIYVVSHPNFIGKYSNAITKEDAQKRLGILENHRVFLFLGGIRPNKGIEMLVDAFKSLTEEPCVLVIAGNPGAQKAYAENLQFLSESDKRIKLFFYFIPDDDLQYFFNASDIVVLPFAKILTSGSAILAMSFSRPVIAPRMGCLPELLEPDCGWLYDPGSLDSLKAVMQSSLISNSLEKGTNAFQKISDNSIKRFASQTCESYGILKSKMDNK